MNNSASSDPLSPATTGADATVSDQSMMRALVDTEVAYLSALVAAGIAPSSALDALVMAPVMDLEEIAARSRDGGNPVIPLVNELRSAVGPDAATWVHRGATSQDILDSALMLLARRARAVILADLDATAASLAGLADEHRGTLAVARTLTQHSVPITWGLRAAYWLNGLLDARDELETVPLPAQLGGASGTFASFAELGADWSLAAAFAAELELDAPAAPWHTNRAPVTRLSGALVRVTDALGVIGTDVATMMRTEIAELQEPGEPGTGGSSAMPHKRNPVLSVLLRSTALRAPGLLATVHTCAALAGDERPDGPWHAEWPALRELLRLALGAAALAAELTAGLTVDGERAAANLALTGDAVLSERAALSGRTGSPADYLGLNGRFIDDAIQRARK